MMVNPSKGAKKIIRSTSLPTVLESRRESIQTFVFITVPPDGGYGILLIFAGFILNFLIDGIIFSFSEISVMIANCVGGDDSSSILAISKAFVFISGPFACAMINRFSLKLTGAIGALISIIALLCSSWCSSYYFILISHAFVGSGFGMILTVHTIANGYYFDKFRPLTAGLASSGSGLGICLMINVMDGWLSLFGHNKDTLDGGEQKHWKTFLRIQAGMMVVAFLLMFLYQIPKPFKVETQGNSNSLPVLMENSSDDEEVELKVNYYSRRASIASSELRAIQLKKLEEKLRINPNNEAPIRKRINGFFNQLQLTCINKQQPITQREDVMFPGPLASVAPSRRTSWRLPAHEKSIISIHNQMQFMRPSLDDPWDQDKWFSYIRNAMKILFDTSILKNRNFLFLLLGGVLYVFGAYVPLVYIVDREKKSFTRRSTFAKFGKSELADSTNSTSSINEKLLAENLIRTIGVTNFFARTLAGALMLIPNMNPTILLEFFLICSGIATIITGLRPKDHILFKHIYCVIFGVGHSFFIICRAVTYTKLLGLEKLTNAYGISNLFLGISLSIGTPVLGMLKGEKESYYVNTFLCAGSVIVSSGLVLLIMPRLAGLWDDWKNTKKVQVR